MGPEPKGAGSWNHAATTAGEIPYFYPEDGKKEPQCTREYGGSPLFSFLTQPCPKANLNLRSALPHWNRQGEIDNMNCPMD